jgi:hypothetical protein
MIMNYQFAIRILQEKRPRTFEQLMAAINDARDEIWGADRGSGQRAMELFDPQQRDWTKVSAAALWDVAPTLPEAFVPKTVAELEELLASLLSRGGDENLQGIFTESWRGQYSDYGVVAEKLWSTRENDREFFSAMVAGRLGTAAIYLARRRIPAGLTAAESLLLVERLALVWLAHDVQRVAALARQIRGNIFDPIVNGTASEMPAGTIFEVLRPHLKTLLKFLNAYKTREERRAGKKQVSLERHRLMKWLRARPSLETRQAVSIRSALDEMFIGMREFVVRNSDLFWDELRLPEASGDFSRRSLSAVQYAGLTPIQMIAVAVSRFVQAELEIKDVVARVLRAARTAPLDEIGAIAQLPRFTWAAGKGRDARERELVHALREAILQDARHEAQRNASGSVATDGERYSVGAPHSDTFRAVVHQFLERATDARRQALTDRDREERYALQRLDVLPHVRFSR